jgi:integrase
VASVYQKRSVWYLRVRDHCGRWRGIPSKARTKTEAKRLAEDFERKAERQRLGLEPLPQPDGGGTLIELLRWWLRTYSAKSPSRASHERDSYKIEKHFGSSEIADIRLRDLTPGHIETFLQKRADVLGPQSLNHLRRFVLTAFNCAKRAGRWDGGNPAVVVKRRRVPKRKPNFLRVHEVMPLLSALTREWRPLFATAIYSGIRKSELFALQKTDVDLENRLIMVRRSGDNQTTKGGHEDGIPIATELVPYLEDAIHTSASDLVFPKPDGKQRSRQTRVQDVLRRALARAGIVVGYELRCRKKACGYREACSQAEEKRCPRDGMMLWPKAKVRPIRFHDLRHTTASLLLMSGASPTAVQRILRHSDPRITIEVYGHLLPDYLRAEIDRLSFAGDQLQPSARQPQPGPAGALLPERTNPRQLPTSSATSPDDEPSDIQLATSSASQADARLSHPFATHLLPSVAGRPRSNGDAGKNPQEFSAVTGVGVTGFEPATSGSQNRRATSCATPRVSPG